MIITAIQQAKKKENRVNIFLDNTYWTSLDKNQLFDFDLYKNKQITQSEKAEIEKASLDGKMYEKAITFAFRRPRSTKEMLDYLIYKRQLDIDSAQHIIKKLQNNNILNDETFTQWFIEQRTSFGTHGENKIRSELIKKGIEKTLIDKTLHSTFSNSEVLSDQIHKAQKIVEKFIQTFKDADAYTARSKLYRKLASRGFSSKVIEKVLKEV